MSRWLTGHWRPRTLIVTCAIALAAFGGLIASGPITGAGAAGVGPKDRQAVAQHILKTRAAKLMTSSAQSVLHLLATGDRHIAPGLLKQGSAKIASGGQGPPTPSFTNVRVNDPSLDTNQVDQTTQSETSIAVAGSNVAVGYNDSQHTPLFFEAGSNLSGYSYSSDGGASFTDGGVVPNTPEFNNVGDPWLGSDRTGAMYYSTLAFDAFNFNGDIAVAKSTDGGKTWGNPVPVIRPPFEIFYFGDKDALTTGPDPSANGRDDIYVAWDDFSFNFNTGEFFTGLPVAHSTDGGATWQVVYADKFIQDINSCSFQQYIGAQPLVDPKNGTLYVAAEKFRVDDPNCTGQGQVQISESIFSSTDGGQTFGPGVKISDVTPATENGLLELGPGQYMRTIEFPTLALFGNALYAAWNDGGSGKSHILIGKSTDGGQSWSVSAATQGSNDEVQPALTDDNGGLHLLFYRRNKDNTLDVMVANSKNGNSFVARRVTTQSFPGVFTFPQFDPIIAFGYMGDYIANTSDGSHQYFAWGDNRDRVTNFMWTQGRNDPDVFFAKQ